MKRQLVLALSVLLTTSVFAQTDPQSPKPKAGHKGSSAPVSKQLEDMKDAISAQQQQIQQLQQQVQNRDQAIQTLQKQVTDAQSAAQAAQQTANAAVPKAEDLDKQYFDPLQHDVTDLKAVDVSQNNEIQATEKRVADLESPLAIHYKGVLLTPGGFVDGSTYFRNRGTAAEATSFNGIPFGGASQAHMTEFYGSGRQSRATLLVKAKVGDIDTTGYYESDFESTGVSSTNNQTNGYTLRIRQGWAQAALANGWTFTGGQMWSLVVDRRKGIDNLTENLPNVIDPSYTVGWTYVRQYAFRVTKNFNNTFWLAGSIEQSQINTPVTTGLSDNFLVGLAGSQGGLYNQTANYALNELPDFVFKGVWEPKFGGHYEAFGIVSQFRDRVFPNATAKEPSALGAYNSNTTVAGFGANALWQGLMNKKIDLGVHLFGDNGFGRYGAAGLPDLTFNSNGTIAKLRNYQGLGSFQYHAAKFDVYAYGGVEYVAHRYGTNPVTGKPEGYGNPLYANYGCSIETLPGTGTATNPAGAGITGGGTSLGFNPGGLADCAGNTRNLIEGTAGFWYKFFNSPMKGRLQMGSQFSYIVRNTWAGTNSPTGPKVLHGDQPAANLSYWATSFRYFLP